MQWREYGSEAELRHPLRLLEKMLHDGAASWELAWFLLLRTLKSQYRQSVLGYIWIILPSLATTSVFVFLAREKLFPAEGAGLSYPLFVLTGTFIWQAFSDAVNGPLRTVGAARNMLVKVNFPREALILAGLAEILLYCMVRLALLWLLLILTGNGLPERLWLGLTALFLLMLLGWSVGLMLLPWGLLYRDGENGVSLLLAGWFLLTPVVYDGAGLDWNPVTLLLVTARRYLVGGTGIAADNLFTEAAACLTLFFLGWIAFRLVIPHVVKRLTA